MGTLISTITENGLATDQEKRPGKVEDDKDRISYIREHLREIVRCQQVGINVCGYYYWTLLDDYEGTSGYRYCFGLAHVDLETLCRTPRQSWYYYQKCIANNTVVP
ncbi:MAG: family 1 glycosylhydrolase [Candidatus Omnitrophota bacterium]